MFRGLEGACSGRHHVTSMLSTTPREMYALKQR